MTNAAPGGSEVTLDAITAAIDAPNQLRLAKSDPQVTIGQPVTITAPDGVTTVLAAQVQGKAEWTFENQYFKTIARADGDKVAPTRTDNEVGANRIKAEKIVVRSGHTPKKA